MRNEEKWNQVILQRELKQFTPRIRQILEQAEQLPNSEKAESIYLYGPAGAGKTIHAALLFLQERKRMYLAAETGMCLFKYTPELFNEIRACFGKNDGREQDILKSCMDAHLLVLDDFASAKPTDWVIEILYLILNHRYEYLRPTVFTSNYSLKEVAELFGDVRITSRIERMGKVVLKKPYNKKKSI